MTLPGIRSLVRNGYLLVNVGTGEVCVNISFFSSAVVKICRIDTLKKVNQI